MWIRTDAYGRPELLTPAIDPSSAASPTINGGAVRSRVLALAGLQVDDRRGSSGFHAVPCASQADSHPDWREILTGWSEFAKCNGTQ